MSLILIILPIPLSCCAPLGSVDICVVPVKMGIQNRKLAQYRIVKPLDSCFRRNDEPNFRNFNTS